MSKSNSLKKFVTAVVLIAVAVVGYFVIFGKGDSTQTPIEYRKPSPTSESPAIPPCTTSDCGKGA